MKRNSATRQQLGALALLGAVLLTYPLVGLPDGQAGGVPAIFLYLFGVWGGIIVLAAWLAEGRRQ